VRPRLRRLESRPALIYENLDEGIMALPGARERSAHNG
jgi:hypothetical protein